MRVAIPVYDETKKVFKNAGRSPFFAVYEQSGTDSFKSFKFVELRSNPRVKADHKHECEGRHGRCHHEGNPEEHKNDHRVMAEILKDCSYLAVAKACKNTKLVFEEAGIKVIGVGDCEKAEDALKEVTKKI